MKNFKYRKFDFKNKGLRSKKIFKDHKPGKKYENTVSNTHLKGTHLSTAKLEEINFLLIAAEKRTAEKSHDSVQTLFSFKKLVIKGRFFSYLVECRTGRLASQKG